MTPTPISYKQWEEENRKDLTFLYREYLITEVLPSENQETLLSTETYEGWTKEKYNKISLL